MIFIPGNVPSSKNGKRWTGKYLISSKVTLDYQRNTRDYWSLYRSKFLNMIKDIKPPYQITFQFLRGTKHRFDYINPLQTIQDLMVEHGWIEDDNADFILPIILHYSYNKDNPGVYIGVL